MVDIVEISAIVAAAGVLVGVLYYILDIRYQTKTRQTDLVMSLYSVLGSKDLLEAYPKFFSLEFKDFNDFRKKYSRTAFAQTSAFVSFHMHCMFYERVGILLHRKLIDIELVDDLLGTYIKGDWEKTKPLVEGIRKEENIQYYVWFEYLYNEIKKREQQFQAKKV